MLLLELNRVLRPGGYFVWSATPVYQKLQEDVEIWKGMLDEWNYTLILDCPIIISSLRKRAAEPTCPEQQVDLATPSLRLHKNSDSLITKNSSPPWISKFLYL